MRARRATAVSDALPPRGPTRGRTRHAPPHTPPAMHGPWYLSSRTAGLCLRTTAEQFDHILRAQPAAQHLVRPVSELAYWCVVGPFPTHSPPHASFCSSIRSSYIRFTIGFISSQNNEYQALQDIITIRLLNAFRINTPLPFTVCTL